MVKNIKKDIKDEKMKTKERGSHDLYDEPGVVGSLGGVAPYAKVQKISIARGKKELEKKISVHASQTQMSTRRIFTCGGVRH